MFFDSHCHLTTPELAADAAGVLERARANGVTGFLNIGDDLASSLSAQQAAREAQAAGFIMAATAGVHPQKAAEFSFEEAGGTLDVLRQLCKHPTVKAVGEIGLDYFYDETHPQYPGAPRHVQERVLRAQIELALELNLPVVLHNRDADDRLPAIVEEYPKLRGVFHCFGSPRATAQRVLEAGFYLGFTGLVTFKNAESVREVAKHCPLDRLLIETDSPYLAPVPYRGKTNEPSYLPKVAETIATLHGKTVEEIGAITTGNAMALFDITP